MKLWHQRPWSVEMHLKLKGQHQVLQFPGSQVYNLDNLKILLLSSSSYEERWNNVCAKAFYFFLNQRNWNRELLSSQSLTHLLTSLREVWGISWLNWTYRGQEGIQEVAREDSACRKGSAQKQACSCETPFQSTNLLNKVDVGRIFCKAKEAKGKGRQTRRQEFPCEADQGWSLIKGFVSQSLSLYGIYSYFSTLLFPFQISSSPRNMCPSWVLHHPGNILLPQAQFDQGSALMSPLSNLSFQPERFKKQKGALWTIALGKQA